MLRVLNEMRQDGAYDRLMDKWGAAKMPAGPLELKGPRHAVAPSCQSLEET